MNIDGNINGYDRICYIHARFYLAIIDKFEGQADQMNRRIIAGSHCSNALRYLPHLKK